MVSTKSVPWPLIIAGLAVVAAIFMYMNATPSVTTGSQVIAPNTTSQDTANASIATANAASQQAYSQVIAQEFGQMVGFGNTIQNNLTQENLATIQSNEQEQLAALQAQTLQTQYNDQLAAQQAADHTSQQNSFWGGLFGAAAAIFG